MKRLVRWISTMTGLLLLSAVCQGQQPPCAGPRDSHVLDSAGAGAAYDSDNWRLCAAITVNLGAAHPHALAMLLRSRKKTGETGGGDPAYDVDFILADGGLRLYRYADSDPHDSYVDDLIEVHALAAQGPIVVTFHSGSQGVSDWWTREHIVLIPAGEHFGWDISPSGLGMSWRHKLAWWTLGGQSQLAVAQPIDPASSTDSHMCHACDKYYQYLVYGWDAQRMALVLRQALLSEHAVDADSDPLEVDRSFILRHLAPLSLTPSRVPQ